MIERAIVREIVGGSTREVARPGEVRAVAERMRRWVQQPEGCQGCRAANAIAWRSGRALCAVCRDREMAPPVGEARSGRALRADGEDAQGLIGEAIVFDSLSTDLGGFREIIKPSAVDRTLREAADVRALWNHDAAEIMGRTTAGTLTLKKTRTGLAVQIVPPQWAGRYVETVERRDVSGMSFAFSALDDLWHLEEGEPIREVLDMHVFEVSPVSFPAYPATSVDVGRLSRRQDGSRLMHLHRWHKTKIA